MDTYNEKERRDEGPAHPPMNVQLEPNHLLDISHDFLGCVRPSYHHRLSQPDQHERPTARVVTHEFEPVETRLNRKKE